MHMYTAVVFCEQVHRGNVLVGQQNKFGETQTKGVNIRGFRSYVWPFRRD